MPSTKKTISPRARQLRRALVANLKRHIEAMYPGAWPKPSATYLKIREETGIGFDTLREIMAEQRGPSIDTLADLAYHLGTTVSELLRQSATQSATQEGARSSASRLHGT